MTLNIQHGNGAVVVVRGPWIDKDSRKNGRHGEGRQFIVQY